MSRPQEEARYADHQPCWGYRDQPESASGTYPQQHPLQNPHNAYVGDAFPRSYVSPGVLASEPAVHADSARMSGFQNYALLDVNNGRLVGQVMYDEGRQRRFVIPVDNQYELFDRPPVSPAVQSASFSVPVECEVPDFSPHVASPLNQGYVGLNDTTTSNFIKDVLGNWEPNVSGTYSPFGQNFSLSHPSAVAPEPSVEGNNATDEAKLVSNQKNLSLLRRAEQNPLADTGRKRIVAEVKPMRPSYSEVAKNNKIQPVIEQVKKVKSKIGSDVKNASVKNGGSKAPLLSTRPAEDTKQKAEKLKTNTRNPPSSGSDSGDFIAEDGDKSSKNAKRGKTRGSAVSESWCSLQNGTREDDVSYEPSSDFMFIQNPPEKAQKKCKKEKMKNEKSVDTEEEASLGNNEDDYHARDNQADNNKAKRKSRERAPGNGKAFKAAEKKKTTNKAKRGKPRVYIGVVQSCVKRWTCASLKAAIWFWYLLSDICRMSAHLTFDLLTLVCTHTYVWCGAVWRGLSLRDSKYLQYIDRKLGDTRFGFWRKIKWFKKVKEQPDPNEASKNDSNIPLPATGDEAMKRLLACKGKDPYSILGVKVSCTDEEIKRYYRRQAFLVHPDKNQQPGAEEAFKILQHAFDLIGEPERREAFDRGQMMEHHHVEAAWSELSTLLAQLHDKMEVAANTIRCTNCGRRHKRVITDRPCYAARYCSQCKIRHSAKEGDIWAESGMWGLLVMYYACMDGAVYQITQWASCQKKNLRQLKPNCHVVQYRIVLGNKAGAAPNLNTRSSAGGGDPNLEEFLNNLYGSSRRVSPPPAPPAGDSLDAKSRRRNKKTKT